jgi:hypothetical protein
MPLSPSLDFLLAPIRTGASFEQQTTMRFLKLNSLWLALVFGAFVEGFFAVSYEWCGDGVVADKWRRFLLWINWPAVKMTQLFFPPTHWPGTMAHMLFYFFGLVEWWIILFVAISTFRRFHKKSAWPSSFSRENAATMSLIQIARRSRERTNVL